MMLQYHDVIKLFLSYFAFYNNNSQKNSQFLGTLRSMTLLECVFNGDDVELCDLIVSIFTTETTMTGVYQLLRVLLLM